MEMPGNSLKTLDVEKTVEDYINQADWRLRENSNVGFSFSSMFLRVAGEAMEKYTLMKVYPEEISRAHINGDLHIHNLSMGIVGYCAGWAIQDIYWRASMVFLPRQSLLLRNTFPRLYCK